MNNCVKAVIESGNIYKIFDLNLINALDALELPDSAIKVYLGMIASSDKDGKVYTTDKFICEVMNITTKTVTVGKRELIKRNIVEVVSEGKRSRAMINGEAIWLGEGSRYNLNCVVRLANIDLSTSTETSEKDNIDLLTSVETSEINNFDLLTSVETSKMKSDVDKSNLLKMEHDRIHINTSNTSSKSKRSEEASLNNHLDIEDTEPTETNTNNTLADQQEIELKLPKLKEIDENGNLNEELKLPNYTEIVKNGNLNEFKVPNCTEIVENGTFNLFKVPNLTKNDQNGTDKNTIIKEEVREEETKMINPRVTEIFNTKNSTQRWKLCKDYILELTGGTGLSKEHFSEMMNILKTANNITSLAKLLDSLLETMIDTSSYADTYVMSFTDTVDEADEILIKEFGTCNMTSDDPRYSEYMKIYQDIRNNTYQIAA